ECGARPPRRGEGRGKRLKPLPGAEPAIGAPGCELRLLPGDVIPGEVTSSVDRGDPLPTLADPTGVDRIVGVRRLIHRWRRGLQHAGLVVTAQHVLGLGPWVRHQPPTLNRSAIRAA